MTDEAGPRDSSRGASPVHTPLWARLAKILERTETWARRRGSINARAPLAIVSVLALIVLLGIALAPSQDYRDWREFQRESAVPALPGDSDLAVTYTLDTTADATLTARVTETITVRAAESGTFVRALPTRLGGNDLNPRITSLVVDGQAVTAHVHKSGSMARVVIALDAGESTLTLTYTLTNLAIDRGGSAAFEWNVLAAKWPTNIDSLAVSVVVPEQLSDAFALVPQARIDSAEWASGTFLQEVRGTERVYTYEPVATITAATIVEMQMRWEGDAVAVPGSAPAVVGAALTLLPLALMGVVIAFAYAARRIAWGDDRAPGWVIAQAEPPAIDAAVAARMWGRNVAVVDAWQQWRRDPSAGTARRLVGSTRHPDRPEHVHTAFAKRELKAAALTRAREGLVRDLFLWVPLVLAAAQIAIVRTLVLRSSLIPAWWTLTVSLLTLAALVIAWLLVRTRQPLNDKGAEVAEHVAGIRVYVAQTRLADRLTASDSLAPYVLMFSPAQRVRALVTRFLPDVEPQRTGSPAPRIASWGVVVVACIAFTLTLFAPTTVWPENEDRTLSTSSHAAGATEVSITAHLDAQRTLSVAEDLTVMTVADEHWQPELSRTLTRVVDGVVRDLRVRAVMVNGRPAPFELETGTAHTVVRVPLTFDEAATHVRITYELRDALWVQHEGDWNLRLEWVPVERSQLSDWKSAAGAEATASSVTVTTDARYGSAVTGTSELVSARFGPELVTAEDRAQSSWRSSTTQLPALVFLLLPLLGGILGGLALVLQRRQSAAGLATIAIVAAASTTVGALAAAIALLAHGYPHHAADAAVGIGLGLVAGIIALIALARSGRRAKS